MRFSKVYFKTLILITFILATAIFGIWIGSIIFDMQQNDPISIENISTNSTSFMYYNDAKTGQPVEMQRLYSTQNHVWADFSVIPQFAKDAVVSIEDERFYTHGGFDIKRIVSVGWQYVSTRKVVGGGSTLTQQLVKNLTNDKGETLDRKVREIWRAYRLEQQYSKDQILEMYMNIMPLGEGCIGIQSAANLYFGKDVSELTIAESASLVGITQWPEKYDPLRDPVANREKALLVLKKMLDLGYITKEQYDEAEGTKLVFKKNKQTVGNSTQSYFVDQVINDVLADLQKQKNIQPNIAAKLLYSGGLKIYTTQDASVQSVMENVFVDDASFPKLKGDVQPQSAMAVIDPLTGQIKGIVGGRGQKTASLTLNRASQSTAQPGSSIKPIAVYAPALEAGLISPGTIIEDKKIEYNIGGRTWSPKNEYSGFRGDVTVRQAVEQSINTVAVQVLNMYGVDNSFNFLKNKVGITSLVDGRIASDGKVYTDKNLNSLALGGLTDGISPLQMAAAYQPFVNKGLYSKPHSYTKVLDKDGKVLLENKVQSTPAMSETTAQMMSSILQSAVQQGTGTPAKLPSGMPSAGKTGTTESNKDRWFVGYTPYYVGAVWFGYDQPKEIVYTGQNPSAVAWRNVMDQINKSKKIIDFPSSQSVQADIVTVDICTDSGLLATDACRNDSDGQKHYKSELFKKGTEPTKPCDLHVAVKLVKDTNEQASADTPAEDVVVKYFKTTSEEYKSIISAPQKTPAPAASIAPVETPKATPGGMIVPPTPAPTITAPPRVPPTKAPTPSAPAPSAPRPSATPAQTSGGSAVIKEN